MIPDGRHALAIAVSSLQLPDRRVARQWELGATIAASSAHDFRLLLYYDSVESDLGLESGGGPLRAQWSARWTERARLASDLSISLPTGDGALHPLSAKAPSIEGRLRLQALDGVWLGAFTRRVSPPRDRVDPQAWFPSGSGFDLLLRRPLGRLGLELDLRQSTAGLPKAGWAALRLCWPLAEQLELRVGAMAGLGPADRRLADSAWQLALCWVRPRSTAPRGAVLP